MTYEVRLAIRGHRVKAERGAEVTSFVAAEPQHVFGRKVAPHIVDAAHRRHHPPTKLAANQVGVRRHRLGRDSHQCDASELHQACQLLQSMCKHFLFR